MGLDTLGCCIADAVRARGPGSGRASTGIGTPSAGQSCRQASCVVLVTACRLSEGDWPGDCNHERDMCAHSIARDAPVMRMVAFVACFGTIAAGASVANAGKLGGRDRKRIRAEVARYQHQLTTAALRTQRKLDRERAAGVKLAERLSRHGVNRID